MISRNFKKFVKELPVSDRLGWLNQLRMQRDQPINGTIDEQREYVLFEQAQINYMRVQWGM